MKTSLLWKEMQGLGIAITNTLVPPTCILCDRFVVQQGGCCPECWRQLSFISDPLCPVMGTPFSVDMGEGVLSAEAIADPPPFSRLRSVMLYDGMARRLVSSLKFSDRTDLAPWMGKWMGVAGKELLQDTDLVIPIPLHPIRLIGRRFNQSAELARHICHDHDKVYAPEFLQRNKKTRQQVGLSEKERFRNVSGAFKVPIERKPELKGSRVLLIDDVYTTGATTKAASREIKRAGAASVDVLVFARVDHHIA